MTALNGLTRPWDSFIQTMCARKESMKFDIVWEDYIQEEFKVANKEALLKDYSSFQCFDCDKIGHISINCPLKREE